MFVNAEIEQREARPRSEACFRFAALQPFQDDADEKPFPRTPERKLSLSGLHEA